MSLRMWTGSTVTWAVRGPRVESGSIGSNRCRLLATKTAEARLRSRTDSAGQPLPEAPEAIVVPVRSSP